MSDFVPLSIREVFLKVIFQDATRLLTVVLDGYLITVLSRNVMSSVEKNFR